MKYEIENTVKQLQDQTDLKKNYQKFVKSIETDSDKKEKPYTAKSDVSSTTANTSSK